MDYPFCPMCGNKDALSQIVKTDKIAIKGEEIQVKSKVLKCFNCKNEFANFDDTFSIIEKAREIYRKKYSIPSPAQIKEFMNENKLSLRNMEQLTGISFKTIDRYLKGAIPDPSNVKLLKLYMKYPQLLLDALNDNPAFKVKKLESVKKKLTLHLGLSKSNKQNEKWEKYALNYFESYFEESFSKSSVCVISLDNRKSSEKQNTCIIRSYRQKYTNSLRAA